MCCASAASGVRKPARPCGFIRRAKRRPIYPSGGTFLACGSPLRLSSCFSWRTLLPRKRRFPFPRGMGGIVFADIYGDGERAVLAHGGRRFNKESWENQARTRGNRWLSRPRTRLSRLRQVERPGRVRPHPTRHCTWMSLRSAICERCAHEQYRLLGAAREERPPAMRGSIRAPVRLLV
jgi:hypothetical protein